MKIYNLQNMKKGWFIGNFYPAIYNTNNFEVAIKKYIKGEEENSHFHKIATEFTIVIDGQISMNNIAYEKDSIIEIEPNDMVKFVALTDCTTVVIKIPSSIGDKYEIDIT